MTCIRCELTRAKIRANLMLLGGASLKEIAQALSNNYEGAYADVEVLMLAPTRLAFYRVVRLNPVPPHVPYVIIERPI